MLEQLVVLKQFSNDNNFCISSKTAQIEGFTHVIKRHQNALSKKVTDQFQCFCITIELIGRLHARDQASSKCAFEKSG